MSFSSSPTLSPYNPGELEDGEFLVGFDSPPFTADHDLVHQVTNTKYLGLVLFRRSFSKISKITTNDESEHEHGEEDQEEIRMGGEYCLMLTVPLTSDQPIKTMQQDDQQYHRRVGLVWIDPEHMSMLDTRTMSVTIC